MNLKTNYWFFLQENKKLLVTLDGTAKYLALTIWLQTEYQHTNVYTGFVIFFLALLI